MKKERKDLYVNLPMGLDSYAIYKELENNGTIDQIRKSVIEKLKTEATIAGEDGFITAEQHIINEINKTIVTNKLADNMKMGSNSSEGIRMLNKSIQNFIYGSTTHKVALASTQELCFGEIDKFVYSSPLVRDQLITGVNSAMNSLYNLIQKEENKNKPQSLNNNNNNNNVNVNNNNKNNSSNNNIQNKFNQKANTYVCNSCNTTFTHEQNKDKSEVLICPNCKSALDGTQTPKRRLEEQTSIRTSEDRQGNLNTLSVLDTTPDEKNIVLSNSFQNSHLCGSSEDSLVLRMSSNCTIGDSLSQSNEVEEELTIVKEINKNGGILEDEDENNIATEPDTKRIKVEII